MNILKARVWNYEKREMQHLMDLPNNWNGDLLAQICAFPDNFHIMLFTGWQDMDKQDIYAGDLVEFGGVGPVEIIYKNGIFRDHLDAFRFTQEGMSYFGKRVGNIHNNPELKFK